MNILAVIGGAAVLLRMTAILNRDPRDRYLVLSFGDSSGAQVEAEATRDRDCQHYRRFLPLCDLGVLQ